MTRSLRLATLGLALVLGCDSILFSPLLPLTVVRLVNNSDFDVEVLIVFDDEQDLPEDILTEVGTELSFTLSPGETTSFSRICDDLQALIVDDADLRVIGGVGPDARTDVLRDGSDFSCGDTITLTFDHSVAVVDFDVSVAIDRR